VEDLFSKFGAKSERTIGQCGRHVAGNMMLRLKEHHFLRKVQPMGKSEDRRERAMCTKHGRREEAEFCCRECNVGLCLENCFEAYHTKLNY
jgi:hypothetical protein